MGYEYQSTLRCAFCENGPWLFLAIVLANNFGVVSVLVALADAAAVELLLSIVLLALLLLWLLLALLNCYFW